MAETGEPTLADRLALVAVTPDDPKVRASGLADLVGEAVGGGVTAVMFREKSLDDRAFVDLAKSCRDRVHEQGGFFILNERIHLASEIRPDAVHLTYLSPGIDRVRLTVGARTVVGRSVHSVEEAEDAARGGVDYLVFGPVFPTPSKSKLLEARGLAELSDVAGRLPLPVVAIGGFNSDNACEAKKAGADGVAVIRAVFDAKDPAKAAKQLRSAFVVRSKRRTR